MVQYRYSRLATGADNIRLLRLMPHENESTGLECELFEYPLQDMRRGTHQYEALSYTWGGGEKPCSILIKGQDLDVTTNLHAALLRLRHRSLARILWVDAICIDQEHLEERGQQVRLMAMIYSKAYCVIVWLEEMTDDVKGALEYIQCAANEDLTPPSNRKTGETVVSNLLQRQWFQRIWVLQEVAAARHVIVVCGSTEIDGYAFCLGLKVMRKSQQLSYAALPAFHSLPSLTDLIERAGLRPKHTPNLLQPYSLRIRSLAELVDMFRSRQASDPRDKVYALLGMSSDDPGIQPKYNISWEELFQNLVKFVLGKDVSVETSSQKAVIRGKGCILGQVSSVTQDDRQVVNVTFSKEILHLGGKIEWSFQATAQSIHERDIVCILYGALKPSIIRLRKDRFSIVAIAATPLDDSNALRWPEISESITQLSRELLLVWDWEDSQGNLENQEEYETLTKAFCQARAYSEGESGDHLHEATKVWNDIMILDDLGEHENADDRIREARDSYMTAFKKEISPGMLSANGRTLLSFVAAEEHEDIVKLLLVTAHPDLKDGKLGQTPLCLAAQNGHEAIVKLLLETGKVEADSKDRDDQTPLSWAAKNGHEAVVKLLLETSKVEADSKDRFGRTPLSLAAQNGYEAIVKLLLETGKVEADSKDKDDQTPLFQAAKNGHEAIVKLLLETGKVEADSKDKDDQTPLSRATQDGHEAIVKLLLETSKVEADSKDKYGQTPLSWAAKNGHKAVVKLLLETSKVEADSKDRFGRTPLSLAAQNGYEAIVKLLLETGKVEADSKTRNDQTPLFKAAKNGHKAVVKLLLETGKVEADSKDKNGQTPLYWAAQNGHEAVVKLLLETSKVEADSKDRFGLTPLSLAAQNGHEAIVKLLLETGKVEATEMSKQVKALVVDSGQG
ncbi:hypothetical protein ACEPPN_001680 [Leptodophora sp. 'Broadleaf-Isolate-01']